MDPDLVFRAQVRDKGAHPILAAAAVIVDAVVAIGLLPDDSGRGIALEQEVQQIVDSIRFE